MNELLGELTEIDEFNSKLMNSIQNWLIQSKIDVLTVKSMKNHQLIHESQLQSWCICSKIDKESIKNWWETTLNLKNQWKKLNLWSKNQA